MARKSSKGDLEKLMASFGAIQQQAGVDLNLDSIRQAAETRQEKENPHQKHVEQHTIDAVLLSLHKPHSTLVKKCLTCSEPFATTYCYVSYCSHHCRVKALEALGLEIDKGKPIWGDMVEPPLVISPLMLRRMIKWAETILSQREALERQAIAVETVDLLDFQEAQNQDAYTPDPLPEPQTLPEAASEADDGLLTTLGEMLPSQEVPILSF